MYVICPMNSEIRQKIFMYMYKSLYLRRKYIDGIRWKNNKTYQ